MNLSSAELDKIKMLQESNEMPEPHLHLIKSIVHQGYRWRVTWNRLHYRPLSETFHQFIISILLSTYGEEWRKSQMELPESERHVLIRWVKAFSEWRKINLTDNNKKEDHIYSAIPSGEVMALMQFAYDIYCLQVVNKLPDFLIKRIKNKNEFQGARYEIAVAAIIARAGFTITFLDDQIKGKKHCEFIAKNKLTNEEIGVEAKSRRRKGVLNEKGKSEYNDLVKGDVSNIFKKACTQKPQGLPYLIFIDLNILPTPEIPFEKKGWMEDLKNVVSQYGKSSKEQPDVYNAIIFTNFSYYYGGNIGDTPKGEYVVVLPKYSESPYRDMQTVKEIWESLQRYSHIPVEV